MNIRGKTICFNTLAKANAEIERLLECNRKQSIYVSSMEKDANFYREQYQQAMQLIAAFHKDAMKLHSPKTNDNAKR